MRLHFGLFRFVELLLVLGLIAVCISFFETACKRGAARKRDDVDDRFPNPEKPLGK
jgi:hypothetical protein